MICHLEGKSAFFFAKSMNEFEVSATSGCSKFDISGNCCKGSISGPARFKLLLMLDYHKKFNFFYFPVMTLHC